MESGEEEVRTCGSAGIHMRVKINKGVAIQMGEVFEEIQVGRRENDRMRAFEGKI